MSLFIDIYTPNGHKYRQPTGLFINNEIVSATGGQTITSLDPAYVIIEIAVVNIINYFQVPINPLPPFKLEAPKMSTAP